MQEKQKERHSPRVIKTQKEEEIRIFGWHACQTVIQHRKEAIRKIYLDETRLEELRPTLAWCAQQKIGYRILGDTELSKLTDSTHHEGLCLEIQKRPPLSWNQFIKRVSTTTGPQRLLFIDGVANPHNFGAILRTAAHFGVKAVLHTPDFPSNLSGTVYRISEGAADLMDMVCLNRPSTDIRQLQDLAFYLIGTTPHKGENLFELQLKEKLVFIIGSEHSGVSPRWKKLADFHVKIPGTGLVESLNVASSVAILLSEHWRRFGA
ncbi:MAG: RNA methyltransferase [SAR324 cluster bacterium]|nr:RNA methyltransferase [SAR324 cluster bacterium]